MLDRVWRIVEAKSARFQVISRERHQIVRNPLFGGGQLGLGHFSDSTTWQGVMLGLDWRPTYTYASPGDLSGIGHFNYAGIQGNVDITTLAVESSLETHFRISAFYLPSLNQSPSYAALGFGATWY